MKMMIVMVVFEVMTKTIEDDENVDDENNESKGRGYYEDDTEVKDKKFRQINKRKMMRTKILVSMTMMTIKTMMTMMMMKTTVMTHLTITVMTF